MSVEPWLLQIARVNSCQLDISVRCKRSRPSFRCRILFTACRPTSWLTFKKCSISYKTKVKAFAKQVFNATMMQTLLILFLAKQSSYQVWDNLNFVSMFDYLSQVYHKSITSLSHILFISPTTFSSTYSSTHPLYSFILAEIPQTGKQATFIMLGSSVGCVLASGWFICLQKKSMNPGSKPADFNNFLQ